MPAAILHQVKMNYKYESRMLWSLNGRFFSTDGVKFEITGSYITGEGPYDVLHTIKNIEKGTYSDIPMTKLIQILQESE